MADSLLIAGTIELLGGGVVLQEGPGMGAQLQLYQGYKMGAPVIDNDTVESLLLDGERPYGQRASNRTMEIPVLIRAPGRVKLMQAREQLLELVDQQAWELTYQPDGLLPFVFDCFRATYDIDPTGLREEKQDYAIVNLAFQAYPYGRSTDPQVIQLIQDETRTVAPILIDGFDIAPVGSHWSTTTFPRTQGTRSAFTLAKNTGTRVFAPLDLSAMTSIHMAVTMTGAGVPFDCYLNLYDSHGLIYNVGRSHVHLRGNDVWDRLSWTLSPPGDFDITSVYGYQIEVTSGCYLDDMEAVASSTAQATPRGAVMQVPGVQGTARAPLNLALSLEAGGVFGQMLIHRVPLTADLAYTPLVPLDPSQTPNGTLQPFPTVNDTTTGFRFNGTYTVLVNFSTWGSSSSRTVTVTLTQSYNDPGATNATSATATVTATVDKTTGRLQVMGQQISLPLTAGAKDNNATSWQVGITSTDTSDRVSEVMFLDTRGETLIMHSLRGISGLWVDEPDTIGDPYDLIGKVIGGTSRGTALSVASTSSLPYRPLALEPGDNQLLLYSPDGAPQGTATVFNRWRTVRLT